MGSGAQGGKGSQQERPKVDAVFPHTWGGGLRVWSSSVALRGKHLGPRGDLRLKDACGCKGRGAPRQTGQGAHSIFSAHTGALDMWNRIEGISSSLEVGLSEYTRVSW